MILKTVKKIHIKKLTKNIDSLINLPSSKSLSIRALLLSAFANGHSTIKNVLNSDDTNDCINALKSLNIDIKQIDRTILINGCNGKLSIDKNVEIFVGSSGITSRFLTSLIVASDKNFSITLNASEQLKKRTIKPLVDTLNKCGAKIKYLENEGFLPILIEPSQLKCDYIEISGKESSQYVSSILMASPLLENVIKIKPLDINSENHPYIKMALQTMGDFGVNYIENNGIYAIKPQNYKATDFIVETDFNTAGYFFALALMSKSKIEVNNINNKTLQPGLLFLQLLEKIGAKVEYKNNSIVLSGNNISGGFNINMFEMAEMVMTLAVIAVFANNPIEIHGVAHIRNHESDRILAICTELKKLNIKCEEYNDGLKIYPGKPIFTEVESYNDHRIAMSLAILGTSSDGIIINNPSCVSKTCPEFFELLEKIGVEIKYEY